MWKYLPRRNSSQTPSKLKMSSFILKHFSFHSQAYMYVLLLNFLFSFFRYITFLSCRFCFCASTNVDMAKNSTQWWKTSHLSIFHHPYNADMMRNFSSSHFVCIPHQCSKWWDNKILTWLISIRSRQHLTKLLLLPSIMMLCVILKQ